MQIQQWLRLSSLLALGGDLNEKITSLHLLTLDGGDSLKNTVARSRNDGLHLSSGEDDEGLTSLDLLADLAGDLDDGTGHGRTDRAGDALDGLLDLLDVGASLLIVDDNSTGETVEGEVDVSLTLLVDLREALVLDEEVLAGLDVDADLLVDVHGAEEVASGDVGDGAVLLLVGHVVVEDARIEGVGDDISVLDAVLAVLLLELGLGSLEVVGRKLGAGTAGHALLAVGKLLALEDGLTGLLREAPRLGNTEVALEVLDDGGGEVELAGTLEDVLLGELVLDHEVGEVADDLGGRSDLDDVTAELVGLLVGLLDLRPLAGETELVGLVHEVGVLTAGHLVGVDIGGAALLAALEGGVDVSDVGPVVVDEVELLLVDVGVERGTLEGGDDGAHGRLGGHAGHGVDGDVDDIGAGLTAGNHGGNTGTGGVVGVDVDGEVGILLADGADEESGGLGGEEASHILDVEDVDAEVDELTDGLEVVVDGVLGLVGVSAVAGVADGGLNDTAGGTDAVDAESHVLDVVEGVEDSEDIHAVLDGELAELVVDVIGVGAVADGVGASEEHLEGNVGDELTHLLETLPRVLSEESHGDIEGGATPALEGVEVAEGVGGVGGDGEDIAGSHSGGEEGLVSISPGGIGEEEALVVADGLGEGLGALLLEDLAEAAGGLGGGALGDDGVDVAGDGAVDAELRGVAVDDEVAEVLEGLLASVLDGAGVEEVGVLGDEEGGGLALEVLVLLEEVEEEGDVGVEATDAVLGEGAVELLDGLLVGGAVGGELDEEGVVVGGDLEALVADAIETDAVAGGLAVAEDDAGVGLEVVGGVLSGDTGLDGVAVGLDLVLGEAELLEGVAGGDLELGLHDIDAGDLLGDGVLDLDSGVHLHEVVATLLVDKELDGTGVSVVEGLAEVDGGLGDAVAQLGVEVVGGGVLDDLLVAALHGAVTLVEVDDVAGAITEDLDLDVAGLFDVALDEDGAVAEGVEGLTGSECEAVLEVLHLGDHSHTLATTTEGGLDDDGEADLLAALLGLLVGGDGTGSTGHDGDVVLDGVLTGGGLIGEDAEGLDGGADEDHAGLLDGVGEVGVLGQEAVAGVDGGDAVLLGDAHDVLDVEVLGDGGLAGIEHEGLVGLGAVKAEAVLLGVDGDGGDAKLLGGSHDTEGDLTTIGGHDLLEGELHVGADGSDEGGLVSSEQVGEHFGAFGKKKYR